MTPSRVTLLPSSAQYPHWADDYEGWLAQFDCFPRYKDEKKNQEEERKLKKSTQG